LGRRAIELIFDVNPFEWVAQQYAGDYEEVQRAGVACEHLAEFNTAYATVIKSGLTAVRGSWEGNAFDSANTYFTSLAATVEDQVSTLASMAASSSSPRSACTRRRTRSRAASTC
jgi:hypothetical protein